MMMSKYVTCFTQLSLYAPNNVDTNEKKQECFLNGLDDGLPYALKTREFPDHGIQGSCAREYERNTITQAQAVVSDSTNQQPHALHQHEFFTC
jgi:hypothetical protein